MEAMLDQLWGGLLERDLQPRDSRDEGTGPTGLLDGLWETLLVTERQQAVAAETRAVQRSWHQVCVAEHDEKAAEATALMEAKAWRKLEERLGCDRARARRDAAARREQKATAQQFWRAEQQMVQTCALERARARRERDLARAKELLVIERQLFSAKEKRGQAAAAVAEAECTFNGMRADPCYGDMEKMAVQQHLFLLREAEGSAVVALQTAREAAALSGGEGWAATSASRRLAALRTLSGAPLPRELRGNMKATPRCNTWPQVENATTKAARHKRHTRTQHKAACERLTKERRLMCSEEKHSRLLNNGVRRTRLVRGAPGWREVDKRRTRQKVANAFWERLRDEQKRLASNERTRLEAQASAERATSAQRKGVGAGRRCEGPATVALRALQKAKAMAGRAPPARAAVPRRVRPNEVRDAVRGTRAWSDPRAPNSLGVVEEWLADDVVAEARGAETADEAGGSDSDWGAVCGECVRGDEAGVVLGGGGNAECGGGNEWTWGDEALASAGAGGGTAYAAPCGATEEQAWGLPELVGAEVASPFASCSDEEDAAGLEEALERARQTALELGERDVCEW